jgi:hypothetical protein
MEGPGIGRRAEKGEFLMKKHLAKYLIPVVFAGFALVALPASGIAAEDEETNAVEITGVVQEGKVDSDGYLQSVKVGQYTISQYGLGPELLELVGQKVSVVGELVEEEDGSTVLDVSSYELVEG